MAAAGIVVKFEFSEPDADLVVDMAKQEIGSGEGVAAPLATMRMTADLGSAYWQGKVNRPLIAPLGKKRFPLYVAALEADGRHDLVVA